MEPNHPYRVPDAMWEAIRPLLPKRPKQKGPGGRPRMDDRKAMDAIFYVLRTGCQWKALPRSMGAASTVHDRFAAWTRAGVFERMWRAGLAAYDQKKGSIGRGSPWTGPSRRPRSAARPRGRAR